MYTSDNSLIDDDRLRISDDEVSFEVETSDGKDVYSTSTDDYADSLEISAVVEQTMNGSK